MESENNRVLCTICARGGSKGVPRKNVRNVGGKPLLAHSIEHARTWGRCDDLIVSTDDEEIATVAREYGASVPFERPQRLASDDAAKLPVVQHAVAFMKSHRDAVYDFVVDLDPSVPLREVADIERAFQIAIETDASNVHTAAESERNPYYNMMELNEEGYAELVKRPDQRIVRRQDAPAVYSLNGSVAVYDASKVQRADTILSGRTKLATMPPERSFAIDRPIDLKIVEILLDQNK